MKLPGPSSPVYGKEVRVSEGRRRGGGERTHVVAPRRTTPPQPFPRCVLRVHRVRTTSRRTRTVVARLPAHAGRSRTGVEALAVGVLVGDASVRRTSSAGAVRRRRPAEGRLYRRVDGPRSGTARLRLLLELRLGVGGGKEGGRSGAGLVSLGGRVFEGALVGVERGVTCSNERERRVPSVSSS